METRFIPNEAWDPRASSLLENYADAPVRGMHEIPYMYLFNANSFADGTRQLNQSIQTDGDADFALRQVIGIGNVISGPGFWQLRNPSQRNSISARGLSINGSSQNTYIVAPEKVYPRTGLIGFDLDTIAKAVVNGQNYAFLVFYGVKRLPGPMPFPYRVPYRYKLSPFKYVFQFTVDFFGLSNIQKFQVPIIDYDFEWYNMTQCVISSTSEGTVNHFRTGQVFYKFYDSNSYPLMRTHIPDSYLCDPAGGFNADGGVGYCFPVPAVAYPRGGAVTFEVIANAVANPNIVMQLVLNGAQRIPC